MMLSSSSSSSLPKKRPISLAIVVPESVIAPTKDDLPDNTNDSPQWDLDSDDSDMNSLFEDTLTNTTPPAPPAQTVIPSSISGLFLIPPTFLPQHKADALYTFCSSTYFPDYLSSARNHSDSGVNQVMLFERAPPSLSTSPTSSSSTRGGLPAPLQTLIHDLSHILHGHIPNHVYGLLFPSQPTLARQAIINLYHPGEGISPHVDLLNRYADGIIGVSLGSGCTMQFSSTPKDDGNNKGEEEVNHDLYLAEKSILVLSGDARYRWAHGIEGRTMDYVAISDTDGTASSSSSSCHWVPRRTRISITLRWLLPGADVVGGDVGAGEDTS